MKKAILVIAFLALTLLVLPVNAEIYYVGDINPPTSMTVSVTDAAMADLCLKVNSGANYQADSKLWGLYYPISPYWIVQDIPTSQSWNWNDTQGDLYTPYLGVSAKCSSNPDGSGTEYDSVGMYYCNNLYDHAGCIAATNGNYSLISQPVSSFTCTPTSQYLSTDVVCTDTSTNTPTSWLWTIDGFGVNGWQTSTSRNFSWQSAYAGIFSVNLQANNSAGSDWENKTNYVTISGTPTGFSHTMFRCTDANTGGGISGCSIQLLDVEAGTWSNTTNATDGLGFIDTLPLHTINAYGQSTGYTSGSRIGVQEWNMMTYTIPMIPGYLPPADIGKVWVYVHVTDWSGIANLVGATVSLSGSGLTTQVKSTDGGGIAMIQWPNVTMAYINVAKSGYTTGMKVITTSDFGPDFVTVALHTGTITGTITPTPLPGEATARPTYAPGCDPSAYDAATCNTGKDNDMMNQIRDAGPGLVGLAIIVTMLGLIKLMMK